MASDSSTSWTSSCAFVDSVSRTGVWPLSEMSADTQPALPTDMDIRHSQDHEPGNSSCHTVEKDANQLEEGASGEGIDHQAEGVVSDCGQNGRHNTARDHTSQDTSKHADHESDGQPEGMSHVDEPDSSGESEAEAEAEGNDEEAGEEADEARDEARKEARQIRPLNAPRDHDPVLGLLPRPSKTVVPEEVMLVAKWARKHCEHFRFPDAPAWLVKSIKTHGGYRMWTTGREMEEIRKLYPEACRRNLVSMDRRGPGIFANGQPLLGLTCPILTCGGVHRPRTLYRAVHADMPHGGTKARGIDKIRNDPLFFQRHMQNHLRWCCRRPSPFISTASRLDVAVKFACMFEARGKHAIKILVIDTEGEYWDHGQSRLWDVGRTMSRLGMAAPEYTRFEYLVEHSIPSNHIGSFDWDEVKERLDDGGMWRKYWRKQFKGQESQKADRKRKRKEEAKDEQPAKKRKATSWNKDFDVKIQERM